MSPKFPSTDDERASNVMRKEYRPLSYEEQLQVQELKDLGTEFVAACHRIGKSRELALAITNMEQAVMWGVKWVTGDKP